MKKSELSKRISKLEGRPFPAADIRLAYNNFMKHGIEHRNPKMAKLVKDLADCVEQMNASVPTAPPEVQI